MALILSAKTGNWSDTTVWTGGVVPGVGDSFAILSTHNVTLDVNKTVGPSSPPPSFTLPTISTSAGGTVTSLPTGSYRACFTQVDSNGKESGCSPEMGATALTNGTSKPRITLPALATGITSYNLYLSAAGGGVGTETLYCTGITGTTVDLVGGSWGNTYSAGAASGGSTAQASAAHPPQGLFPPQTTLGGAAGRVAGTLTFATGIELICRGEIWLSNGGVIGSGAGFLTFDPTQSISPTTFAYGIVAGTNNTQASNILSTSGTSSGNRFTIRTDSTAGNKAARLMVASGTFGQWVDSFHVNVSYCNFTRIGDTTNDSIQLFPSASTVTETFDHCTFDTCGRVNWLAGPPQLGGWAFTNCTWKNTNAINGGNSRPNCLKLAASNVATGTRNVQHCSFDTAPVLVGGSSTNSQNFFYQGFDNNSQTTMWSTFDASFVRNQGGDLGGVPMLGPLTNTYCMWDTAPAITSSGTATGSQTTTTLKDTGQAWTVNAFAAGSAGIASGWTCYKYDSTNGVEAQNILSNTSNTLTLLNGWQNAAIPGVTVYEVRAATANPHIISLANLSSGLTLSWDHNVVEFTGGDNNGDCFLHLDAASAVMTVSYNLILPSASRDNSGTLITLGGTDNTQQYTVIHNTYFTGAQCFALSEGAAETAGVVVAFKSNIAWCYPTTYHIAGGGGVSALGPYKTVDSSHVPPTGTADLIKVTGGVSAADYNCELNSLAGWSDTNHPGGGVGYNVNSTVVMGTHDIDVNPNFIDSTRNFYRWAVMQGSTGSGAQYCQVIADALTKMQGMNDDSWANPGYVIKGNATALWDWVRAGFSPTNASLNAAGADGITIGAISFTNLQGMTGGLSFSGSETKLTTFPESGTLSFSASLAKQTMAVLSGVLSFAGSMAWLALAALAATLTTAGSVVKSTTVVPGGALSFSGSLPWLLRRSLSGVLSFSGGFVWSAGAAFTAALSFVGLQAKSTTIIPGANLSFAGSMLKLTGRALSGVLSFVGGFSLSLLLPLIAVLSFAGSLATKSAGNVVVMTAALSFSGSIGHLLSRTFAGLLAFVGNLVAKWIGTSRFARYAAVYATQRYAGTVFVRVGRCLQPGNDAVIMLLGMRDCQSGAFIDDGQLTFSLLANWNGQSGGAIPGATNIPLNYQQGSKGQYLGRLSGAVGLSASMNPVAVEVVSSNYALQRRTILQVAPSNV